jgi:hypothetical protein
MNKEIVAGVIFFIIWLSLMVAWGNNLNIRPNVSSSYSDPEQECFNPPLCR